MRSELDQNRLAGQELEPATGQELQPSLAAIEPAEASTEPSAPAAV